MPGDHDCLRPQLLDAHPHGGCWTCRWWAGYTPEERAADGRVLAAFVTCAHEGLYWPKPMPHVGCTSWTREPGADFVPDGEV